MGKQIIYDVHTHLFAGSYEKDRNTLLKAAEVFGISKLFVSSLEAGLPNPTEEQATAANIETFKFKKDYPDLIEGYIYVSPEHKNSLKLLRQGMEDWGACGLKLWVSTYCDDEHVFPLVEQMIEYNAPILIHSFHKAVGQLSNETTACHVANLAKRYPEAKLLMAHQGGNAYHALPVIRDFENVSVDISCSISRGDDLAYTIEMLGEDRILYGTDMPGIYVANLGKVMDLDISQQLRDKIFYKNAQKLFGR